MKCKECGFPHLEGTLCSTGRCPKCESKRLTQIVRHFMPANTRARNNLIRHICYDLEHLKPLGRWEV